MHACKHVWMHTCMGARPHAHTHERMQTLASNTNAQACGNLGGATAVGENSRWCFLSGFARGAAEP